MEKTYTVTSLSEAQQLAIKDFDKLVTQLTFKIVSEKGGIFGDKQYLIKVSDEVVSATDGIDKGREYIANILSSAGLTQDAFVIEKKVRTDETGQTVEYSVNTKDMNGYLIGAADSKGGHGGQNLNALQFLVDLVVNACYPEGSKKKVIVDVGGFKKKRVEHLEFLAVKCAKEVLRSKKEVTLTRLNSYERRIVHARLSDWNNIKTRSEGEGMERVLIIYYENPYPKKKFNEKNKEESNLDVETTVENETKIESENISE